MRRNASLLTFLVLTALGAVFAFAACGDDESETTVTEPAVTTTVEPETTTEDTTTSTTTDDTTTSTTTGEDVSGNCDEAEHANDPECQGKNSDGGSNSGPGGSGSGSGGSGY